MQSGRVEFLSSEARMAQVEATFQVPLRPVIDQLRRAGIGNRYSTARKPCATARRCLIEVRQVTNAIDQIAKLSERLGYRADAILRNYDFSDVAAEHSQSARRAELAVFTQTPPSYRSAAFGVSQSSVLGPEATVRQFRSLGAPLFFVIEADDVSVWQIYAKGPPRAIQRCKVDTLNSLFQVHRQDWLPDAIHRAKSIGQIDTTYQLDFVDAGLIPALEGEIHDKLDRLLRESLTATNNESTNLEVPALFRSSCTFSRYIQAAFC